MTRVWAAAAIAVAERDEPSITAISPKNSPLPSVTMTVLVAPLILAISTLPSSTTNSSRPLEPSSKMTSFTSYSLMHFSMAMECPAFWLVRRAMLVGKRGRANATAAGLRHTAKQHDFKSPRFVSARHPGEGDYQRVRSPGRGLLHAFQKAGERERVHPTIS